MTPIYLTSIELFNFRKFEHFKSQLGMFVCVRGGNGTGKTSLAQGISQFWEPGGNANLIRAGCEEAKSIITFSNGYTAEKIHRKDGYDLNVRNPQGGICAAPATILNALLPRNSFDPAPFLYTFDLAQRTDFILDHLPVSFPVGKVNECLSVKFGVLEPVKIPLLPKGPDLPLKAKEATQPSFEKVYSEMESARQEINREITALRGAQATLEGYLPQDSDRDWVAEQDRLQKEFTTLEADIRKASADIKLESERKRTSERKRIGDAIAVEKQRVDDYVLITERFLAAVQTFAGSSRPEPAGPALEQQGIRVRADLEPFIRSVLVIKGYEQDLDHMLHAIDEAEHGAIQDQTAEKTKRQAEIAGDLGTAKAKAAEQQKGQGVRDAIAQKAAELENEESKYGQYTAILQALEKLKAVEMRRVDIEGFDIRFEKLKGARKESAVITIDGLPLDELNTQQALFVCLKLAMLAQKANTSDEQLPFVLFETPALTETHRLQLKAACERKGYQLVMTMPESEWLCDECGKDAGIPTDNEKDGICDHCEKRRPLRLYETELTVETGIGATE